MLYPAGTEYSSSPSFSLSLFLSHCFAFLSSGPTTFTGSRRPWRAYCAGNVPVEPGTDFDEIMTSGLCAVCSQSTAAAGGCNHAALRNVPSLLPPPPFRPRCGRRSVLCQRWNCIMLSLSLCCFRSLSSPLLPSRTHLAGWACGYGFEEAKRLARDKRICFTATTRRQEWRRREGDEIWIALSPRSSYNGGTLNCRNRATDNSHRQHIQRVFYCWNCSPSAFEDERLWFSPRVPGKSGGGLALFQRDIFARTPLREDLKLLKGKKARYFSKNRRMLLRVNKKRNI